MTNIVCTNGYLVRKLQIIRSFFSTSAPFIGLYRNNYTPMASSVLADFLPCNYDGATLIALNWPSAPFSDGPGSAFMFGQTVIFTPTGMTTPNMAYGWYVIDSITADYIYGQRFDGGPVAIGVTLDSLPVQPTWRERNIS